MVLLFFLSLRFLLCRESLYRHLCWKRMKWSPLLSFHRDKSLPILVSQFTETSSFTDVPLEAVVPVVDRQQCAQSYRRGGRRRIKPVVDERHLCAGDGTKDSCSVSVCPSLLIIMRWNTGSDSKSLQISQHNHFQRTWVLKSVSPVDNKDVLLRLF